MKLISAGKDRPVIALLGACVGIIVFFAIFGVSVVIPTNTAWLSDSYRIEGLWDMTQHYLGWVAYRNTPWHFPIIGLTDGLNSQPISVAYTDSIPLFAIFFKLLSPVLPARFQYLGIFEILSYALTGALGALVPYRYRRDAVFCGMSSAFFVLSPVLLKRALYHTALSAPFLILAAMLLWINADEISRKKNIVYQTILSVISLLINPYYVPMVIGIMLCMLLQKCICGYEIKKLAADIMVPVAALFPVGYFTGLFYGDVSANAEGMELVSYNLNQLINPADFPLYHNRDGFTFGRVSYSRFFDGFAVNTEWQNEGFSYLGLGVILLAIMALLIYVIRGRGGSSRRERISYAAALFTGFAVFLFLAVSPYATAGTHILYHIKWNDTIYRMLSTFRTAGRMIWPIHFGIMTLAILSLAGYTKDKSDTPAGKGKVMATVIMAICLIIQIIDISPAMERKHDAFLACSTSSGEEPFADNVLLRSGGWHYLADRVDEVVFMPPTGETISTDPFWTCTFIEYAMENDISLSATYCSRNLSDANDAYAVKRLSSQDDAVLFVLYDDHYENVDIPSGLNLYRFEGLVIATREDMWGFPGFDRP